MLEWFTTIPGILIICGVILLVIAIILFIVGAKKNKKEGVSTTNVVANDAISVTETEANINDFVEKPVVSEESMVSNFDTVVNAEKNNEISVSEPIHIEEPAVTDFNTSVSTEINNESFVNPTPIINITDEDVKDDANTSTVYGGEIPTVDFAVPEEKPVTIYGGNDPLDATQTLPKMEEHHVPYGGNYPEVRIVEPTISSVAPTPVEDTVVTMPSVEPTIINIPSEEQVVPEINDISIPVEDTVVTMPSVEPTIVNIPTEEQKNSIVEEL